MLEEACWIQTILAFQSEAGNGTWHVCLQASYGKCSDPFMFSAGAPDGGYCAATCNRCPSGTTPTPTSTPAATPTAISVPVCTDTPPNSQYSCQEQASYGKCSDPFMFGVGAPEGGYCAATCNRCPPGTWSPSQPSSTAPAASPGASPSASPVAMGSPGMTNSPAAPTAAPPVPVASPAAGSPSPYSSASPASPTASPTQAVSPAVASPPTSSSASPVASPAPTSPGSSPAAGPVCADVAGPFDCAQQVCLDATCHHSVLPTSMLMAIVTVIACLSAGMLGCCQMPDAPIGGETGKERKGNDYLDGVNAPDRSCTELGTLHLTL